VYPTILDLGVFKIHSYGVMIAIGFFVALWLVSREAGKAGINTETIQNMALWTLLVGLLGARLLYILMFPSRFSWDDPVGWIAIWNGGLVYQGAPAAAIPFCFFYMRRHALDPWKTGDIILAYLPLGQAIGRIGCFLNGCCYGKCTDVPWGIRFPAGSPAAEHQGIPLSPEGAPTLWSAPVHPTQLYSSVGLALMCLLFLYLRKKWHPFDGFLFPLYLIVYSGFRFVIEFFRGDNPMYLGGSLSEQQLYCIGFAVVGVILYVILARRKPSSA